VATRVEGRVRQHRYPNEFDFIQNTVRIIPTAAAPAGLAALIDVKPEFVDFRAVQRRNRAVGANHGAHPATHARVSRVRTLINAVINGEKIAGPGFQADRRLQGSFAVNAQFNGANRTNSRTTAAQRALFFAPENLPGQIFDA